MINKKLLSLIFEAASIERWNDHIRPSRGFSELDKQSHKMLYAYVLGKCDGGADMGLLVEGGIFEFLHRIVLTDIKPPIFHKLMAEKGEQINKWVLTQLCEHFTGLEPEFYERFSEYLNNPEYAKSEKKILKAAHFLATTWEFDIIYGMCRDYYGIEKTKKEIEGQLDEHRGLTALSTLYTSPGLMNFANLVGELRFQQRWSRTPKIPATSVMGHMLAVAVFSFLCSLEIKACGVRRVNNFWGGLFHDLPEVLTRDIVSPVKNSVDGLDEIIKDIEKAQITETVFPLLPKEWHNQILYYTQDEFDSKIILNDKILVTTSEEINKQYNSNEFEPLDGQLIRACDHLSAHMEAYASVTYGVKSDALVEANRNLYEDYKNSVIGGVDFGRLFEYFEIR